MTTGSGRLFRRLYPMMAVALLSACPARHTGPIRLDMSYTAGAALESIAPAARGCAVRIDSIVDERINKQSLGQIGAGAESAGVSVVRKHPHSAVAIYGEDIEGWVRRVFYDLGVLGYGLVEEGTESLPVVRLNVTLKHIYIRNVNSSLESVVRLTARYTRADGVAEVRAYRGGHAKVNWAFGAEEIMAALNHAMVGAIRDVARDLPELCGFS